MNNEQKDPSQNSDGEGKLKPYKDTLELIKTLLTAYQYDDLSQARAYIIDIKRDKSSILSTKGTKCQINGITEPEYTFRQFLKDYDSDPRHVKVITSPPKLNNIKYKVPLGLCRQDERSAVDIAELIFDALGLILATDGGGQLYIRDHAGTIIEKTDPEWTEFERLFFARLTENSTVINLVEDDLAECNYVYFSDYEPTQENEGETHISSGESG